MSEIEVQDELTDEEKNAVAWLRLSEWELVERSASLGLPGDLHPEPYEISGTIPSRAQVDEARKNADQNARDLAGDEFVDKWISENRSEHGEQFNHPDDIDYPPIPYFRKEDQLRGDGSLQELPAENENDGQRTIVDRLEEEGAE